MLRLTNNVIQQIQNKNVLNQSEKGSPTRFLKTATNQICSGIESCWRTWQQSVVVNNIQVNGGACVPNGPVTGAIGIGVPGCISQRFQSPANEILGNFPTDGFEEITPGLRAFVNGISQGLLQVLNQWVSMITLSNIMVNGGICSCQITPAGPVPGSFTGGIGQLPMLQGNLQPPIQGIQLLNSIRNSYGNDLLQSEQGTLTPGVIAYTEALVDGFGQSFQQWLQTTSLMGLQVNGGTSFPGAPLVGAMGSGGRLV